MTGKKFIRWQTNNYAVQSDSQTLTILRELVGLHAERCRRIFYFMEYSYLLRDPRWQKKRLLIFNRDEWKCRRCADEFTNLQVHHLYYNFDLMPWEYPDTALITLCEVCHKKAEFIKWVTKHGLIALKNLGFTPDDIYGIQELVSRKVYQLDRPAALRYMDDIKTLMNG